MSPLRISGRAVTEWAALRGVRLGAADHRLVSYRRELEELAEDARARKSAKRTATGLLCYRIREPVDAQLVVDDGPIPTLVSVRKGFGGNAATSDWYSTPADMRNRKPVTLTLSPAAREALDELAERSGVSRSQLVERLVLEASRSAERGDA